MRISDDGVTLTLTLNRPEKRNALTVELVSALRDQVGQARHGGYRMVAITGAPPAFCAGGDLGQLSEIAAGGAHAATDMIYGNFHGLVRAIRSCPLPVLAAVNGPALGAGLDLALICDLRICTPTAQFASSWVGLGLIPGMGGAHVLPRLIGGARSAKMLLLAERIDADTAASWGLVSEVVPEDRLIERIAEFGRDVAALPEDGIALTKAAMRRGLDTDLDTELQVLGEIQGSLLAGDQFQQRAAALLGRGPRPA
jgi:2-(1,2-epoxy-1,2-dihydrophenyl)acetyl-CoA isomerase